VYNECMMSVSVIAVTSEYAVCVEVCIYYCQYSVLLLHIDKQVLTHII
jgi:hypothetical protein